MATSSRRGFLRALGVSAGALPFLAGLPSLGAAAPARRQRLVLMFSPNGTVPVHFWPDQPGEIKSFKRILAPLEPFRKQTLLLQGIANKVRGDGDAHMRGMSCLLTGIELFPGNIQGGSHTPAGWPSGISIDQELRNFLQSRDETRTRLGSLELGVNVPNRADPWTRWSYAGPNKPVAPLDDPYQVFEKMYGQVKDKESLKSILDDVQEDLKRAAKKLSAEDRRLLEEHLTLTREAEQEMQHDEGAKKHTMPAPELPSGVGNSNDNMPKLARMQVDLLVNALANDMARVATLQFTNSVGNARMRWLGVDEGHHTLSHDPDLNESSQEKLAKINTWYCEQLAYLARRLADTPEPGGAGSMLDNTLLVWTNELGKGNSHTLENIPFVLVGGGCGFKMGRAVRFEKVAHNRLWVAVANAMGHSIKTFGNPRLCDGGALELA